MRNVKGIVVGVKIELSQRVNFQLTFRPGYHLFFHDILFTKPEINGL
jgi:hypothetical protein